MFKGYRTIAFNVVVGLISIASTRYGFDLDHQAQAEIATGVLAVGNIGLRFITTGKVGEK
jgi:hypothetical protein